MSKAGKQASEHTNPWFFAIELGIFAGLIWGGIRWLIYVFRFTKVIPGFLAEPFFQHAFLMKPAGQLVGYLFYILFSVIASLIYVLLFRKLKGPWPGMLYGVLWWAGIFLAGSWPFLQQPMFKLPGTLSSVSFASFYSGDYSSAIRRQSSIRMSENANSGQSWPERPKKLLKGMTLC